MPKLSINDIIGKKGKDKITMLTCYDYSFASLLCRAGIDILLVGDSMANVVLGLEETRKVSFSEMFNHTRAVARAAKDSFVIADMPARAYQKDPDKCVYYAGKFIAAGADAVKVEWFEKCAYVVRKLIKSKIPVMGHIGLTPQTAHLLGGYKVQGRLLDAAEKLTEEALLLQSLGCFSIVIECVPYGLAGLITDKLRIPTIGIGAGRLCDGQVLVLYDFLGLYEKIRPRFVRVYADLGSQTKDAAAKFIRDVKDGNFPSQEESFK